jgi:cell division protein YceG involved in septum cleavage
MTCEKLNNKINQFIDIMLLIVLPICFYLTLLFCFYYVYLLFQEQSKPVECRNNKVYEISYRDNIKIYDETLEQCEVIK